jgi:hypothetical protein
MSGFDLPKRWTGVATCWFGFERQRVHPDGLRCGFAADAKAWIIAP